MKIIAPSILSADFTCLAKELAAIKTAGADWIHIDVMDGRFAPDITYGPIIVEACKRSTDLIIDTHLMIENPDPMIPAFIKAGANYISIHAETCIHLHRTIQLIKDLGANAGVALNPATPISAIQWVIEQLDFIVIMSVNPGFGGQKFISSSLKKIQKLNRLLRVKNSNAIIQVDGGINLHNISAVAQSGASCFVAGSAIFKTEDYFKTISNMRQLIQTNNQQS